jgi:hypothetical protein
MHQRPRVWGQRTRRRRMIVSRLWLARIMREQGFVGTPPLEVAPRPPDVDPAADRLQRVFSAERPKPALGR